jgi:RHS repeat-associated protein
VAGNSAGNVYTYSSSSWSSATALNSGKSIYVSCTSSAFCAAVASKGKAFTYNGTWSSATTTGSSGFDAVSCATSDYCVAVDGTGGAFTYTGSAWSNDADIDGGTALNGVSCAQAWDCVAVDASENEVSDLGSGFGTQLYSTTTPATPVDPAGMIATTTYTPGGEAAVTTKPSGQTIDTYGQMDDLSGVTYTSTAPGYSTPANVSYTYNVDGSQASMTDGTGTTDYSYDDNGDTTEIAFAPASGTGLSSSTVQYGYYSTGVLDALTYPSYGSVSDPEATYTYDDQGNMVSMTDWDSNKTTFTYDADQNLKSTSFPTTNSGGSAVENSYDRSDNLTDTTVVDSAIWTTSPYKEDLTALTRNPDSLIATSTPAGGSETTLGYDASDRLTTGLGTEAYTYDSDSRLSTDTPSGGSTTNYSYDTGSELCATETSSSPSCTSPASSTTVYGYDSDGDRCYQAATTSTGSCASPPAGSTLETYGWDQAGDLTCVTVANSASATCASPNTSYTSSDVYNGDGLRVADTPAGASEQQFTWDTTTSVPRILRDGTNEYLYGLDSITPIEQIDMSTGAVSYLVSDNQGVRMGLASTGASEGTESYNSYGKAAGSTGSPFGFAGGYTDATALVNLIHRYYDPATEEFLSIDPLNEESGEPYQYSDSDPTNSSDPDGTLADCPEAQQANGLFGSQICELVSEGVNSVNNYFASLPDDACVGDLSVEPAGTGDEPLSLQPNTESRELEVWRTISTNSTSNFYQFNWKPTIRDIDGLSGTLYEPFLFPRNVVSWFTSAFGRSPGPDDEVVAADVVNVLGAGFSVKLAPEPTDPLHVNIGGNMIVMKNARPVWEGPPIQQRATENLLAYQFNRQVF